MITTLQLLIQWFLTFLVMICFQLVTTITKVIILFLPVWWIWNNALAPATGWIAITPLQAAGIVFLANLLAPIKIQSERTLADAMKSSPWGNSEHQ